MFTALFSGWTGFRKVGVGQSAVWTQTQQENCLHRDCSDFMISIILSYCILCSWDKVASVASFSFLRHCNVQDLFFNTVFEFNQSHMHIDTQ